MKRLFCILTAVLTCICLCSCKVPEGNAVCFYYCREPDQYQYFESEGVIRKEYRSLSSHRNDLKYIISLYLAGPTEEGLEIPFSKSTKLLSVQQTDSSILIELSDHTKALTDSEFSLACSALALTCMDFTVCDEVTIVSGDRTVTMGAETIMLFDSLPQQETTGG